MFELRTKWKKSFGKSLRQIRRSCTPPMNFLARLAFQWLEIRKMLKNSKNSEKSEKQNRKTEKKCKRWTTTAGHWKANRAKKFIGGVHDRRIFLRDLFFSFLSLVFVCLSDIKKLSGHWKANRAKKIIGGVHDRRIFLRDFPKEMFQHFRISKMLKNVFWKIP